MRKNDFWLCVTVCVLALTAVPALGQDKSSGGVTVYQRIDQLDIKDAGKGPMHDIPVKIAGSTGLKLAFLARATGGITTVPLNMFDSKAQDNTTPKAYAWVDDSWRPVLYRCDRFRYNGGGPTSTVRAETAYENVRFHGSPTPDRMGVLSLRNFVIYRGEDVVPPGAPTKVAAGVGEDGIRLSWQVPSDNVGVALYLIGRADTSGPFVKIAESGVPAYVDKPSTAGNYRYRVLAVDFENNVSLWSETVAARINTAFPSSRLTDYDLDRLRYTENIRKVHAAGRGKVVKGRVLQFGDSLSGALNYQLLAEAALGRYMVEARGRAGWTSGQGRTVITQDLKEVNPEFCLLLYGTNNTKSAPAIAAAMDDMLSMAQACAAHGTVPIIATIPPRGFTDPHSQPEANYNAALIKASRTNNIPLAYLFEALQTQPDRKKFLAGDGVHWAGQAFTMTSQVWKKAMEYVTFALLDRPD